MSLSAAELDDVRKVLADLPSGDGPDLSALQSIEEVLGYMIAYARAEGRDEVEWLELFIRLADLSPERVRRAERVLRRLGYTAATAMMRRIAGRRKHDLAPLQ